MNMKKIQWYDNTKEFMNLEHEKWQLLNYFSKINGKYIQVKADQYQYAKFSEVDIVDILIDSGMLRTAAHHVRNETTIHGYFYITQKGKDFMEAYDTIMNL